MKEKIKHQIRKAPQSPGIYAFKNKRGELLYIGKAANLRNRARQYLRKEAYSPFLEHLLNEAEKIDFKTTDSEIEALILESKLIKENQPKYNIMLRDDKQYFYVGFTNDEFPKIFLTHQPSDSLPSIKFRTNRSLKTSPKSDFIGPFTDGTALKITLRLLRRIFPYCTCKQPHYNFCLNYHIGKCLGYCCLKDVSRISYPVFSIYKKNIKVIKDILTGKKNSVIKGLKKELNQLAEKQDFEKAIQLRNKVQKLEKIFANAKIILNTKYPKVEPPAHYGAGLILKELSRVFNLSSKPKRIEGYDVSNIQGKNATGAMVVFTNGKPDKNEYRKFRIRFKKTPDDIAMLKEVITRRMNHPEWPYPDLVFIDGGIGQLNAANAIIHNSKFKIPVVSLAKGKNEVFSTTLKKPMPMKKLPTKIQNLILQIDAEAHRFAIRYYRKLHRESVLPKSHF